MKDIDVDQLDDLRDEMEDMMFETQEMNDMYFSKSLTFRLNRNYAMDVNEAELDAELQELDDELFKEALRNNKQ
jgi:hypothetical protein